MFLTQIAFFPGRRPAFRGIHRVWKIVMSVTEREKIDREMLKITAREVKTREIWSCDSSRSFFPG